MIDVIGFLFLFAIESLLILDIKIVTYQPYVIFLVLPVAVKQITHLCVVNAELFRKLLSADMLLDIYLNSCLFYPRRVFSLFYIITPLY
jgi:hypothetical protein